MARRLKVSEGAVRKRVRDGTIPLGPGGKIDPALAARAWAAGTDWSKPSNAVTGRPAGAAGRGLEDGADFAPIAARDDETIRHMRQFAAARAAREAVRARRDQLALQREEGKLVDVDQVRETVYAQFRRARDQVMALPDRLALSLSMQDQQTIHAALLEEARRICADLSRPVLAESRQT